ncbi:DUF6076 domain-containing protein [Desulfallas thermosapovorans]|uniref:Uncharacterized protein n=1 Tax=Desulfallas thermosapovorans DSM 6562 TaxID=1121431 RepID=A0A5S4ZW76_9FIRM|nr:DUF6076 domain-containing protein [Desulfallas thermosapovorans]TYO97046.1 hypothetical protein LX24_00859 [Desulfallas thermosapovorans DSM 6562]
MVVNSINKQDNVTGNKVIKINYSISKPYCITRFPVYREYTYWLDDKPINNINNLKGIKIRTLLNKLQIGPTQEAWEEGPIETYNPLNCRIDVALQNCRDDMAFVSKYGLPLPTQGTPPKNSGLFWLVCKPLSWAQFYWGTSPNSEFGQAIIQKIDEMFPKNNLKDKEKIKTFVLQQANEAMNGVHYKVQLINGYLAPAVEFDSLWDVAWFQFLQNLDKGIEYRQCPECGNLFVPEHGKQKFCPPVTDLKGNKLTKRSTCENTWNQRKKRERNKEKKVIN